MEGGSVAHMSQKNIGHPYDGGAGGVGHTSSETENE